MELLFRQLFYGLELYLGAAVKRAMLQLHEDNFKAVLCAFT